MVKTKRRFVPNAVNHCYQKTANGEVLFYNVRDFLVFFTLFCVAAKRANVQVLSLVLMWDHIHHCSKTPDEEDLSGLVQDYTSHFASVHNPLCHKTGPLFLRPFGSAPKIGDKNVRTALIYLGNNGPVRKLAERAEQYRWSFLAYYKNPHPFSEPLKLSEASKAMRRAVSLVKDRHSKNQALHYQTLKWMFKPLSTEERYKLIDFIISTYNVIDYESAIAFFGSFDKMLEAMHITSGSEYDIQEEFVGWSDKVYEQMTQYLTGRGGLADIHDMFKLSEAERRKWIPILQEETSATERQVMKYLRLPQPSEPTSGPGPGSGKNAVVHKFHSIK